MTSLVTLEALSHDVLLIEKIEKQNFWVQKNLNVYSKTQIAILDPRYRATLSTKCFTLYIIKRKFKFATHQIYLTIKETWNLVFLDILVRNEITVNLIRCA